MPACFTKPIRRLLTHKWQLASLVAALIAVASLIPKWYGYPEPEPHRSILLIHDLSIATGLGCAILAYYFAPRKPSPLVLRDRRTGWMETNGPKYIRPVAPGWDTPFFAHLGRSARD